MDTYKGKDHRFFFYKNESIKSISLAKHFFNGYNCEEADNMIFLLKNTTEEEIEFSEFVNYLYENYNDKLFMSH